MHLNTANYSKVHLKTLRTLDTLEVLVALRPPAIPCGARSPTCHLMRNQGFRV